MKQVLLLGAGFVAGPLVRYLLDVPDVQLKIATRTLSKAQKLLGSHPRGVAQTLNVEDEQALKEAVSESDLVISLLPWIHHLKVARMCLALEKNMVTTSYVKPEMKALDEEVKKKGLLFLNEIGVDPGIDHMAAMRIIDRVKSNGGKIESFYSYCGGLPALESNNNPLGYKFSWSPVGVMLAALSDGHYLQDGREVVVPSEQLFEHYWLVDVPGAGTFEAYVNRDAFPYIDLYNIHGVKSMYRGTLRNISHCESWNYFKKLGLFNQEEQFDFGSISPRQVIAKLAHGDGRNIEKNIADYLHIPEYSITIKKLKWLGLLNDELLPLQKASAFDMFAYVMQKKLIYAPGERDLLVQHHEFVAGYANGKREKITSTMVDLGIPDGETSMARTVSLPAAIASRLILQGKIHLNGVHIPVLPEIYNPVLEELEGMNIKLKERKQEI